MIHHIHNTATATTLGSYEATDPADAVDLLAQDKGFDGFADAVAGGALDPDEMAVTAGGTGYLWRAGQWQAGKFL